MRSLSSARRSLVVGLSAFLSLAAAAVAAETYKVDPVHSTAIYRISHLGSSWSYGRFDDVTGSFTLDEADPTKSTFAFSTPADKINSGDAKRDQHLKSPDFFDAKQFPEITFKSTSVKAGADKTLEVTGDLTLHGTTKPVTVTLTQAGTSDAPNFGHRTGFETTLKIKRSDFGMTGLTGAVGDEVTIIVSVEGVRQ